MGRRDLVGDWDAGFRQFSIVDGGGALLLVCPEAPAGYEGRLTPTDPETHSMQGGPFDGAEILERSPGAFFLGGEIELCRLDHPAAAPPGWGLRLEHPKVEPDDEAAFQRTWNRIAHPSRAQEVDLDGRSVCRFVQWLTQKGCALFYGCHSLDLDEIRPGSWPMPHFGPASDRPVIYARDDAICSMYLSLVDHATTDGVDQGVEHFYAADGSHMDLYHFSASRTSPDFASGVLYVLARDGFDPVPIYRGGPLSGEWVSAESVRPLARLAVTPNDFPLLDSVAFVG